MAENNLLQFLSREVYPRLWSGLDVAFQEFGFQLNPEGRYWKSTNEAHTRTLPGSPRPDRVNAYFNTPFGFKIHGGDFIQWLSYLHNPSAPTMPRGKEFIETAQKLSHLADIAFPELSQESMSKAEENERQQAIREFFFSYAQEMLLSEKGNQALAYAQSRGFTREYIQNSGKFGFYPSASEVQSFLLSKGFSQEEIGYPAREVKKDGKPIGSALVYDSRWESRLIGVWRDRDGRIANFWARDITGKSQDNEKYLLLKGGSKDHPFGIDSASGTDIVVTEGFMDVLLAQMNNANNIVAVAGKQITPNQIDDLIKFGFHTFNFALNSDVPGQEGTEKSVLLLLKKKADVFVATYPEMDSKGRLYKDAAELIHEKGIEAFSQIVKKAEKGIKWIAKQLSLNIRTDKEREDAIQKAISYSISFKSSDKKEFLSSFAKNAGIPGKTMEEKARENKENNPTDNKDMRHKNKIEEMEHKTYIWKDSRKKGEEGEKEMFPVEMANFTMEATREIYDDQKNVSWIIKLNNGSKCVEFEIEGNVLCNVQDFRDAITKKGAFLYHVTETPTHNLFIDFVLKKGEIQQARKTQYLGKIDTETFLASNVAIKKNEIIRIEDSVYFLEKQPEITISFFTEEEEKKILRKFVQNIQKILREHTWKVIGFVVATLFSEEIFDWAKIFPILFERGKHGTGKTSIAYWICALFCAHNLAQFNIGSTQKSYQRAGQKYKSIPIVLNEYQSNEKNNTLLCSIGDRQGYARAETSNNLGIKQGEINSPFIVCSTQNIIGIKAEDALSRCIELDTNECKEDKEAFDWMQNNIELFSCFVHFAMSHMDGQKLVETIKRVIPNIRHVIKGSYEERILKTHGMIAVCYNEFIDLLGDDFNFVSHENTAKEIAKQTRTTAESDLGQTFLKIAIALVRNKKIDESIGKIKVDSMGEEIFIFSLVDILPFVRAQGKSSEIGISDEKTIANAIKSFGCEKKKGCRELAGVSKSVWFYKIDNASSENIDNTEL